MAIQCPSCGRPGTWNEVIDESCCSGAMYRRAKRERDEALARLERLEAAIRHLADHLDCLQNGLSWMKNETGADTEAASDAICCVVSMVSREGSKMPPGSPAQQGGTTDAP